MSLRSSITRNLRFEDVADTKFVDIRYIWFASF